MITTADFIRKARAKHGDFYDYSQTVYAGANTSLTIVCPVHGAFTQLAADHANAGKGCKLCGNLRGRPTALTASEFVTRAKAIHSDFYDYSSTEYVTTKLQVSIRCSLHGEFLQNAGKHLRGAGCPVCRKGKKLSTYSLKSREDRATEWREASGIRHGGRYDYSRADFINTKIPVEIICPDHGSFFQSPGNHRHGGCKCPMCAMDSKSNNSTKSHLEWLSDLRNKHDNLYDYSPDQLITSCQQHVSIVCRTHGAFTQQAYVHLQGHGCPRCVNKVSKPEEELRMWVETLLPIGSVLKSVRSIIPPHELDIFIPSRNLAIEFNGNYWHSDSKKDRRYHQTKSLGCRDKGIQLLHIYEYEWDIRKEVCKQLIMDKLRLSPIKFHARKLDVRIPNTGDARAFLEDNHFQGSVPGSVEYGLFEGNTLLSLMTFGKPRYTSKNTWELLRFCSLAGTNIRGGAGKLFRHFSRVHLEAGDTVVSYARLDYSNGKVYDAMGFVLDGVCDPDYVWLRQGTKPVRRQASQKHKLPKLLGDKFDASLSEEGNMRAAGYKRIYSAGNLRYIYTYASD